MFLSHTVLSREDLCKNFLLSHVRKYYTTINKRTRHWFLARTSQK